MVVQCTWKSTEGRDINDAISWALADELTENDVEEEVQAENCLLLVAPSDTSPGFSPACQLLISCHPLQRIQYISILSDARIIEVYGHHGEYLQTIKNELLEEVEDMAVFKGDIKLEKTLNMCSIKFACLHSRSELWLYGVKVGIINVPNEENGQISYAEIERRLSEMELPLSDKAKAFKELLEAHPEFPSLQNQDINTFINLFKSIVSSTEQLNNLETVNNNQNDVNGVSNMNGDVSKTNDDISKTNDDVSNTNDDVSNTNGCISNTNDDVITEINGDLLNGINNNDNNNNSNNIEFNDSSTQTMDPPPPNIEDILKLHIDQKIEELEKQLSEKMEKCFKEMETKLFCKLDEIESFVKPQGVQ